MNSTKLPKIYSRPLVSMNNPGASSFSFILAMKRARGAPSTISWSAQILSVMQSRCTNSLFRNTARLSMEPIASVKVSGVDGSKARFPRANIPTEVTATVPARNFIKNGLWRGNNQVSLLTKVGRCMMVRASLQRNVDSIGSFFALSIEVAKVARDCRLEARIVCIQGMLIP